MVDDSPIISLVDRSPVEHEPWQDRGRAPKAYVRGMAVAFARLFALLNSADDGSASRKAVVRATTPQIGDPAHDVLAWYAAELSDAGASVETADAKLVALFGIMLGLGMRESSGQHCVGADTPEDRGEPTTEENAEAGLFQVSHDSVHGDPLRAALFNEYKGRTDLLDIFRDGVHCNQQDLLNHGTGDGAKFQETMKMCPLFAALYTAMFLRQQRKHWGPINTKKAEVKQDAVLLFRDVQKLIDVGHA